MDGDELVRLDYEQTSQLVRALTDIRFRLLAFVPTIAGAAVAFLSSPADPGRLVGVGLLGLAATLGIFLYELRNSEVYDAALDRAAELERRLGIPSVGEPGATGGLFGERPRPATALFGRVTAAHRRGIALVYAAALGGWTYLVAWGGLAFAEVPGARTLSALAGLAAGAGVLLDAERR